MRTLAILIAAMLASSVSAATVPASRPAQNSASAAGASFAPQFSAGGQHLVFISHANNLVTNDNLAPWLDVFVRDLAASNTVLASVNISGIGGGNADAHSPSISSNGQFVAFVSRASNLISGDTNNAEDVFVRDLASGTTRLVSVDVNGFTAPDPNFALNIPLSGDPLISENGRWVIFESRATNLTATPAPLGSVNIYARDLWSNVTVLVTADTNGFPLADKPSLQSVSGDGRYVSFLSSNLSVFNGVTNVWGDAYVRDLESGATIWASTNLGAVLTNGYACRAATLNAHGGFVVLDASGFSSNGVAQSIRVFRQSLDDSAAYIAIGSSGTRFPAQVSADGRYVLYQPGGLLVFDCLGGTNQFVGWDSMETCGTSGRSDGSGTGSLSRDGRSVAFRIIEGWVCSGLDTPEFVYHRNLDTGVSNVVAVTTNGQRFPAQHSFITPMISPDGTRVIFDTLTSMLVERDFNNANDIFLRDVNAGVTELISAAHTQRVSTVGVSFATLTPLSLSSDGQFIVFTRLDEAASPSDTNRWPDVFLSDTFAGSTFALSINTNPFVSMDGSAPNTNAFASPIIAANGRAIAALRHRGVFVTIPTMSDLVVARTDSNGVFNTTFEDAAPLYGWDNGSPRIAGTSGCGSFSADGQLLAFHSTSSPVAEENYDNNNTSDVFVRHLTRSNIYYRAILPTNFLISVATNSYVAGSGTSTNPLIRADGRWVAFLTTASNLVNMTPTNIYWPPQPSYAYSALQLMAIDLGTNRTHTNYLRIFESRRLCSYTIEPNAWPWYSSNTFVRPLTNAVHWFAFSQNAPFIFFSVPSAKEVYRHDLLGTRETFYETQFISNGAPVLRGTNAHVPGATNLLACTNCTNATVSADGELITFQRLRAGTSNVFDIYARDLRDGRETLVSGNLSGALANGSSTTPLISSDGRFVVFQSKGSDLIASDTNGFADIFVRDRLLGVTMLVSATAQGRSGNGPSTAPVLAPDGRTVAFQSFASDLAPGDFNDKRDIFVLKLGSADSDGDGLDDDWELAYFETLARDGTGDDDHDGINDRAEFLAGTDPTNGDSIFRVLTVSAAGSTTRNVIWTGNPARNYRVEFKDNVTAANWNTLNAATSWNGSTATATDTTATNAQRFYRVVRLP